MIEATSEDLVVTYVTLNGGEILQRQFDYSHLVEMKRMGIIVSQILDMYVIASDGTINTDFTITSAQINNVTIDGVPPGQAVGFILTNVSAIQGAYQLFCKALLSNGEQILSWMNIQVEGPSM